MALLLFFLYWSSWLLYATLIGLLIAANAGTELTRWWLLLTLPMAILTIITVVLSLFYYGAKDTLTIVLDHYVSRRWKLFLTISFFAGMLIFISQNTNSIRHNPDMVVEYHRREVCGLAGLGIAWLSIGIVHLQGMLNFGKIKLTVDDADRSTDTKPG